MKCPYNNVICCCTSAKKTWKKEKRREQEKEEKEKKEKKRMWEWMDEVVLILKVVRHTLSPNRCAYKKKTREEEMKWNQRHRQKKCAIKAIAIFTLVHIFNWDSLTLISRLLFANKILFKYLLREFTFARRIFDSHLLINDKQLTVNL